LLQKKRILFVEQSSYVRSLHILDLHESSLEIEINPNKERQERKYDELFELEKRKCGAKVIHRAYKCA
jgi:hypothetical protein